VRQEVVHVSNGNVVTYGGDIIKRVVAFNVQAGLKGDPLHVFHELATQMVVNQPHTLIQAIVTDEGKLVGHCITHINELYGHRTAMIYQLHVDEDARDDTRQDMFDAGWNQIVSWAEAAGCKAIRAWAMNGKLAEVFKKYGLKPKPYTFVETEIE
jgi:hypothetical protein